MAAGAPVAAAQLPTLPVLQNGFVRPGWGVAANIGSADESLTLAAAAAWAPASARFQVSGGAGIVQPDGDGGSHAAAGLRVAVPIPTPWTGRPESRLGLTAFAGGGLARWEGDAGEVRIPVGVGIGYRMPLGDTRALSVFATPFYSWSRATGEAADALDEDARSGSLFRASVGAEALVSNRIGVTLGYEFGSNAGDGRPGPSGGIFGAGVSYIF